MRTRCAALATIACAMAGTATAAPDDPAAVAVAAELLALRDVRVPAEVAGRVVARPENETAAVREGDVVVALDDEILKAAAESARAAAERAKAQHEWAKLEFERERGLFERGSTERAKLERAEIALREAAALAASTAATAEGAEARLARTRIRAPFDGRLVRVHPERGEYLQPGQTAFRIVDDSALRVVAYVPAQVVVRLERGQAVQVVPETAGARLPVLRAEVFSIAPAAEGRARTFRVEARVRADELKEPAKRRWRPGMTARLVAREEEG